MWEQIASNRRKSLALIAAMGLVLGLLGASIGLAILPPPGDNAFRRVRTMVPSERPARELGQGTRPQIETPRGEPSSFFSQDYRGGLLGLGASMSLWFIWVFVAYYGGDKILMGVAGARRIARDDSPRLCNVVEEMAIAAGLPKPPDVYVVDDPAINAFATGRRPDCAAIAVTSGALARLNRDQLQGVVAHEISHVVNRDTLFMTMAGILVGSISLIAGVFLRGVYYGGLGGGGRRSRGGDRNGGGQAVIVFFVIALVMAVVAPILSQLLYFALSRRREYLADASAAMLTRYPEGLASALEVIAGDSNKLVNTQRVTAPMYISNPLDPASESSLTSTHPPVYRRIDILRAIGGSVSFADYERALEAAGERRGVGLPASAVSDGASYAVRPPSADAGEPADPRAQMREALDLTRQAAGYTFLACSCGMRIKMPASAAGVQAGALSCPRCGRPIDMPTAQAALAGVAAIAGAAGVAGGAGVAGAAGAAGAENAASAAGGAVGAAGAMAVLAGSASGVAGVVGEAGAAPGAQGPAGAARGEAGSSQAAAEPAMRVVLQGKGWTTFRCTCGKAVNVSPAIMTDHVACPACGRRIHIDRAEAPAA